MDTLTHMAIGAAAGELVLGKREGGRAVLCGALAGAMPDLDMVPTLFMEQLARLDVHRGYTHSILFALLISPILGYLASRMTKTRNGTGSRFQWMVLVFIAVLLHIGIDCLTTYGTRIFLPLSDYRVAVSSIAFIDPVFTMPLIVAALALVPLNKRYKLRRIAFMTGLFISSIYLIFTLGNKLYIESVFEESLKKQHYAYSRLFTTPLPFSNLLWVGIAEGDTSYYMGYHSLLDKDPSMRFNAIEKNHDVIRTFTDNDIIKKIISITLGLYSIEKNKNHFVFNDLRYGSRNLGMGKNEFMFSFIITNNNGKIQIRRKPIGKLRLEAVPLLFKRMRGETEAADASSGRNS
jgi:inner membrane protein